jgi:hypothetical protein
MHEQSNVLAMRVCITLKVDINRSGLVVFHAPRVSTYVSSVIIFITVLLVSLLNSIVYVFILKYSMCEVRKCQRSNAEFGFVASRKKMKMNLSTLCWDCKVIGMQPMLKN